MFHCEPEGKFVLSGCSSARGAVVCARKMKAEKIRLFVKPFCGWCHEAKDWLDERGATYEELDVVTDRAAFQEMKELSGQTRAPVIEVDGEVLADFDTEQLEAFWKKMELD
jgi:glutaredoxin 3